MEENDLLPFDLSKKKKKKKTPLDLDAAMPEDKTDAAPRQVLEQQIEQTVVVEDDISLDLDFGGMKKKKKKKKAFDVDGEISETLAELEVVGEETTDAVVRPEESTVPHDEFSLDLTKKKKKKKKVEYIDEPGHGGGADTDVVEDDQLFGDEADGTGFRGLGFSDRDYTYGDLLTRVFDVMREKKPEMMTGDIKKFVMRPPQVVRVGTRKTSFVNFSELCRLLHRQPKHVLAFLLAELGTSGSVDGNNQLLIRGRYIQKQIENVLRKYIKEYVTCHTCRSRETILQKDTRLFFLQCETCGSRCSVASIKTGFQAVTGRRAAIRAKTA